jgi:hypothetical protein
MLPSGPPIADAALLRALWAEAERAIAELEDEQDV